MAERPTHPRIHQLREARSRHLERSRLYRIGFGILAGLVILIGVFLTLPGVPGPGLVVIAIGLGMLALEFERAERALESILHRLEDAKEASRPVQAVLVLGAGLLAVASFAATIYFFDVPILPG